MIDPRRFRIVLSALAILTAAPAANAAMAVIDISAIRQLTSQVRTLQQQLATAQNQLRTANEQLRATIDELARQQRIRDQTLGSIGSLRDLPRMGL